MSNIIDVYVLKCKCCLQNIENVKMFPEAFVPLHLSSHYTFLLYTKKEVRFIIAFIVCTTSECSCRLKKRAYSNFWIKYFPCVIIC